MKIYEYIEMFNKKPNLPSYIQKKKFHNPNLIKNKKNFTFFGFSFDSSKWKINKENSIYLYFLNLNFKKILNKLILYLTVIIILYVFCYDETIYCFESQFNSIKSFITLSSTFLISYLANSGYFNFSKLLNKYKKNKKKYKLISKKDIKSIDINALKIIRSCYVTTDVEVKKQIKKNKANYNEKYFETPAEYNYINTNYLNEIDTKLRSQTKLSANINNNSLLQNDLKSFKYNNWYNKYYVISPQTTRDFFSTNSKNNLLSFFKNFKNHDYFKVCTFNDIKKINFKNNNVSKSFENIFFNYKNNYVNSMFFKLNYFKLLTNSKFNSELLKKNKTDLIYLNQNSKYIYKNLNNKREIIKFKDIKYFTPINNYNFKIYNNIKIKKCNNKKYWWFFKN